MGPEGRWKKNLEIIKNIVKGQNVEERIIRFAENLSKGTRENQPKLDELIKKYNFNIKDMDVLKAQRIMLDVLKRNDITALDLTPEFSRRNTNNTFYFDIDGHWNEKGHELAADLIEEELIRRKFID